MNELELINRDNILQVNSVNNLWTITNDIDWYEVAKQDNHKETISNYLTLRYNLDDIIRLQREQNERQCEMEDFIHNYIDSLPLKTRAQYHLDNMETKDLASHIVGLGRTMFNYVKNNPTMIFTIQNDKIACFGDGFDHAIYELQTVEN